MDKDVSIGAMILRRIATSPTSPAVRYKEGKTYREVDFATMGARMQRIAAGLLTVPGFSLEDRAAISILGNSSYDGFGSR